jgi:hypothetical protein
MARSGALDARCYARAGCLIPRWRRSRATCEASVSTPSAGRRSAGITSRMSPSERTSPVRRLGDGVLRALRRDAERARREIAMRAAAAGAGTLRHEGEHECGHGPPHVPRRGSIGVTWAYGQRWRRLGGSRARLCPVVRLGPPAGLSSAASRAAPADGRRALVMGYGTSGPRPNIASILS